MCSNNNYVVLLFKWMENHSKVDFPWSVFYALSLSLSLTLSLSFLSLLKNASLSKCFSRPRPQLGDVPGLWRPTRSIETCLQLIFLFVPCT